jgi:hypothetical protein
MFLESTAAVSNLPIVIITTYLQNVVMYQPSVNDRRTVGAIGRFNCKMANPLTLWRQNFLLNFSTLCI